MIDIKGHADAPLPFGDRRAGCADDLVFRCEWHVTLHLFVFSVKATLQSDVLMRVCGNELPYLLFFPRRAVVFSISVLPC